MGAKELEHKILALTAMMEKAAEEKYPGICKTLGKLIMDYEKLKFQKALPEVSHEHHP